MVKIVLISGKKGYGKDLAGYYLLNIFTRLDYIAEIHAFAEPLKELASSLFEFCYEQVNGSLKETIDPRYNKTPREILQFLGTEIGRSVDQNIWCKKLCSTIRKEIEEIANKKDSKYITFITDTRFENEITTVEEEFGKNNVCKIRLERDLEDKSFNDHPSEIELDQYSNWDYIIPNNGTKDNLYNQLVYIAKELDLKWERSENK